MERTTAPAPVTAPSVATVLMAPGRPLDAPTRAFMEPRFGHDFSHVRIHADRAAADAAHAVAARAFATGHRIVFGAGQYAPHTARGRWLLAHELAHVAQARGGRASSTPHVERDASQAASAVMRGERARLDAQHDGTQLHRFGEPENVPEMTYISTQGSQGFLQQAVEFHQGWGLPIQQVSSVEQMVDHLAQDPAPVGRIRFVTHAAEIGVFTSLFTGEPLESLQQDRVTAYAESDVAGLALDSQVRLNVPLEPMVDEIRSASPALLTPFGLETSGVPSGQLAAFFQRVFSLIALNQTRTAGNAAQFDPLIQALPSVLAHVASLAAAEFPGPPAVSAQQVLALQPAIEAAVTSLAFTFSGVSVPASQASHVREGLRATASGFRGRLNSARARFTRDSWVDIRGCNAGDDIAYLEAVSRFFGTAPNLPHVSAPDWFQIFPFLAFRTVSTVAQINGLAGNAHVNEAVEHWSPLTGVRQQMELLRSFYRLEIARREALAAERESATSRGPLSTPPLRLDLTGLPRFAPLETGLPTTPDDRAAVALLSMMTRPPVAGLPEPELVPSFRPSLSLGTFRLREPGIGIAQSALDRLNAPNGELRYYLDAALVLPVRQGRSQQRFEMLIKNEWMNEAIDGWLGSQWSSAAPGLAALQDGPATDAGTRRVQALVETRNEVPDGAPMIFPPDPAFWAHIKQI